MEAGSCVVIESEVDTCHSVVTYRLCVGGGGGEEEEGGREGRGERGREGRRVGERELGF